MLLMKNHVYLDSLILMIYSYVLIEHEHFEAPIQYFSNLASPESNKCLLPLVLKCIFFSLAVSPDSQMVVVTDLRKILKGQNQEGQRIYST